MIAPAIPDMAISLHITSSVTANLVLTIFLLAFAFGPLVLSPISEVWGRLWVSHFDIELKTAIDTERRRYCIFAT